MREVDLDWRSVAVVLAAFVGLVALTGLVRSTPRTFTAVAVGTLLALALNPATSAVERRLGCRRSYAVTAVVVGFLAAASLVAVVLVPAGLRQARELQQDLPEVVESLEELPLVGPRLVEAGVPERVRRAIERLPEQLGGDAAPLQQAARSAAGGLVVALTTVLFALTLLADGPRLVRHARRLVPARRRPRVDRIGDLAYRVVGRYVAGSLLVAGLAGLAVLVVGLVLGVPLTPMLAVWVAMFDLVPQIGGAAGGIPFVLLGLTQGAGVGLACAVFFVLYLQFENNILSPLVVGQAVELSPPATMCAALIGVSAAGVVGALLAVPLLGAAKAVYLELRPAPTRAYAGPPPPSST